jgi:hypothetical protein
LTRPKLSEPVQSGRVIRSSPPGFGRLLLGRPRLLALGLALDHVEHRVAVLVLALRGVEVLVQRRDELARHLDLAVARLALRRVELDLLGRYELVGEPHRVQREHAVERADRGEVLAVVEREPAQAGAAGPLERVVQQPVRVAAVLARAEVVALLVVDRVDRAGVDEALDVDDVRGIAGRGRELVLVEDHVLPLLDREALDDVVVRDLAVLGGAEAAVLDLRVVLEVDLAEAHRLRLDGGVELDRHVDEADGDCAVPRRAGHAARSTRR